MKIDNKIYTIMGIIWIITLSLTFFKIIGIITINWWFVTFPLWFLPIIMFLLTILVGCIMISFFSFIILLDVFYRGR